MRLHTKLSAAFLALLITTSFFACEKTDNCEDEKLNVVYPLQNLGFRIVDTASRDLLTSTTPGTLSFDSLVARQPCNKVDTLGKRIKQIGAGGLESYAFFLDKLYQPIPDEAADCYTIQLNWGTDNTDIIKLTTRAEHGECGVTYFLDGVTFNGYDAKQDGSGYYVLQRR